jgi:TctA family transporter
MLPGGNVTQELFLSLANNLRASSLAGWFAGCLAAWLPDCLAAWLAGWLAGCFHTRQTCIACVKGVKGAKGAA